MFLTKWEGGLHLHCECDAAITQKVQILKKIKLNSLINVIIMSNKQNLYMLCFCVYRGLDYNKDCIERAPLTNN